MMSNFLNLLIGNFGSTIVSVFAVLGGVFGIILTVVFVMAMFYYIVYVSRQCMGYNRKRSDEIWKKWNP